MDPSFGLVDRLTGLPPGWFYLAAGALLAAELGVLAGRWLHRRLRSSPSGYAGSAPPTGPDRASRGGPDLRRDAPEPRPRVSALHRRLRSARFSPLRQPPRPAGPVGRRRAPAGRDAPGRSAAGDGD
ncbi:hypothetical protein GCM10022225_35100 [Plantactinospora mayteni]|uniref:Uncharacterized protein n=1 Tax=Plantactinospora mayteni TaxID=566021 RepID=A0ABQ4EMK7_9ACTN|nr:hypothetical protein [Plantactinospora mayteni]GIG95880.1 hypothetical protein Pma05_24530 [Plantactinospora mayteni]